LLIIDIDLPDRTGYELMSELRQSKGLLGRRIQGSGTEVPFVDKTRVVLVAYLSR
jgi:CheY-like chemotaxis protein